MSVPGCGGAAPVCGRDFVSYLNDCSAADAGVIHAGPCIAGEGSTCSAADPGDGVFHVTWTLCFEPGACATSGDCWSLGAPSGPGGTATTFVCTSHRCVPSPSGPPPAP